MTTAHPLDWADIQGNILRGYNLPVARHCFYRVADAMLARELIASLLHEVTTAEDERADGGKWSEGSKPHSTLNIAFTYSGLAALGVPEPALFAFPPEFRVGMRARAKILIDRGSSAPEHWEPLWQEEQVHVALLIYAPNQRALGERYDALKERIDRNGGLSLAGMQDAAMRTVDGMMQEHFGFIDGFGNPDVVGAPGKTRPGRGKIMADGTWAPIAAGCFVLGAIDEHGEPSPTPQPSLMFRNGTFMVYRKLHQNVGTFRRFIREEGERLGISPDLLAAKMVGRWFDGTPLELSPDRPDPEIVADPNRNTNFVYADDTQGARCPMGAHIRRANPRDSLGFGGVLVNPRRIIRRGIPYGAYTPPNALGDDNAEHGLVFIAFNASIAQQFEFVQQQWMNYGNDFNQGNDKDPLVGNHIERDKMLIPGDAAAHPKQRTHLCMGLPTFVETRGGDYFFMPSLAGLGVICNAPQLAISMAGAPGAATMSRL
ncbi:MAG TPA: Dyp-type peroxidase [Gemmatimonadaceae bacterium]